MTVSQREGAYFPSIRSVSPLGFVFYAPLNHLAAFYLCMPEVNIYKSRWQAINMMLRFPPFVLGGIWLLSVGDALRWVGWMSVLFFGLGYPLGIYNLLDNCPS